MKSINIKNVTFIIILIVITVVCFSLGIWQIDRYSQKQQLHDTASSVTEIKVDELINTNDNDALIGKIVRVDGDFIENSVFKLDNRMFNATYGVEIFSLFKVKSTSKVYLVNMGWLEIANQRNKLAQHFDFSDVHSLQVKIANIPSKPPFINPDNFQDAKQNDLWLFVNKAFLEKQHARTIETLVLNNMKPPDELKYRTDSKDVNAIMHILYAIQWFLFSFFALFGLIKIYK